MLEGLPHSPSFTSKWALFLDIDGTLLELAPGPDEIRVPTHLGGLLQRLHARFDGACALVSGRDLRFMDVTLDWNSRDAAGCHGAEMRINGRTTHAIPAEQMLNYVSERIAAASVSFPGSLVEIKRQSIAFHYARAQCTATQAVMAISQAIALVEDRFRVVPLRSAIEVIPMGSGKDVAIRQFLKAAPYLRRLPVFAGDDLIDEEAFRLVNSLGGLSIHVGDRRMTAAKYRLPTVAALHDWLASLLGEGAENILSIPRGAA